MRGRSCSSLLRTLALFFASLQTARAGIVPAAEAKGIGQAPAYPALLTPGLQHALVVARPYWRRSAAVATVTYAGGHDTRSAVAGIVTASVPAGGHDRRDGNCERAVASFSAPARRLAPPVALYAAAPARTRPPGAPVRTRAPCATAWQ
jgi:hypothetical protein